MKNMKVQVDRCMKCLSKQNFKKIMSEKIWKPVSNSLKKVKETSVQ